MTDAPDLTPQQDAVRRLLADARHDGPTPPEVVARLDDTLAALVSERREEPGPPHAPVVDLGARRRRTAGIGLLAAAAVVVAGVAIGQGLPQMSGSDSAGSAADGDMSTSQERDFGTQGDDSDGGSDSDGGAAETAPESLKSTGPAPDTGYPTLSSFAAGLDDELLDLRGTDSARGAESGSTDALLTCDLRGVGPGRRVAAQVDDRAGVVVFRRPSGDVQDVALYVCGDPEPVRTLTLPAP